MERWDESVGGAEKVENGSEQEKLLMKEEEEEEEREREKEKVVMMVGDGETKVWSVFDSLTFGVVCCLLFVI